MMGKSQKIKGSAFEREIVNWHNNRGCPAKRQPLSGALKGEHGGDLKIGPVLGYIAECKRRARAYKDLYDAIAQDDSDILFIRADRKPTLVVLPMATYESLIQELGWIPKEIGDV